MSSYPNAYCVKCGTHTETQGKHTVILQNNARALQGVCPTCESDVYRIMPKAAEPAKAEPAKKDYPDAFCVKCQKHTPTNAAKTVILENASRALTGTCSCCGSEVYRLMPAVDKLPTATVMEAPAAVVKALAPSPAPAPVSAAAPAPALAATVKRVPGKALEGALVGQAPKLKLKSQPQQVGRHPQRPAQAGFRPGPVGRRVVLTRPAEKANTMSYAAAFAVILGVVAGLLVYMRR